MSHMLDHCVSLKNINISNFDTSNVEESESMFNECRVLTSLDIRNFNILIFQIIKKWLIYFFVVAH